MTKLLILVILFSAAVRAVVIAKSVILGILFLTLFILALREALVVKLAISDILSSVLFILALCTSFFTHLSSFYILSLLQSTGTGTNLKTSDLSTLIFKLVKLVHFSIINI